MKREFGNKIIPDKKTQMEVIIKNRYKPEYRKLTKPRLIENARIRLQHLKRNKQRKKAQSRQEYY